jgi:hypothetical protein
MTDRADWTLLPMAPAWLQVVAVGGALMLLAGPSRLRRWTRRLAALLPLLALVAGCTLEPDAGPLWSAYGWRGDHRLPDGGALVAVDLTFDGAGGVRRVDTWRSGELVVAWTTTGRYDVDAFCCVTVDFRGTGLRPAHVAGHTIFSRRGPDLMLSEAYGQSWRFRPRKLAP